MKIQLPLNLSTKYPTRITANWAEIEKFAATVTPVPHPDYEDDKDVLEDSDATVEATTENTSRIL